jgi:hypothetical protein
MIDTDIERKIDESQQEVVGTIKQDIVIEFLAPERYADIPKGKQFIGKSMLGFFYFEYEGRPARLPERFVDISEGVPATGFPKGHNKSRGEKHGMAKLTAQQVKEMRRELRGGATYGELAIKYRVSKGTVAAIRHRRLWKTI